MIGLRICEVCKGGFLSFYGKTAKIEAGKRADAMTRARQKHQRCEEERTGSSVSGYGSEERCCIKNALFVEYES